MHKKQFTSEAKAVEYAKACNKGDKYKEVFLIEVSPRKHLVVCIPGSKVKSNPSKQGYAVVDNDYDIYWAWYPTKEYATWAASKYRMITASVRLERMSEAEFNRRQKSEKRATATKKKTTSRRKKTATRKKAATKKTARKKVVRKKATASKSTSKATKQCKAKTASGKRCKRRVSGRSAYCSSHRK